MNSENAAMVALEKVAYHFDKPYTYLIPQMLAGKVQAGCRVMVPFGTGNRKRQGIVLKLTCVQDVSRIKAIASVLDEIPLLNAELLALGVWLRERTFCTYFEGLKSLLPAGINLQIIVSYSLAQDCGTEAIQNLPEHEKQICCFLSNAGSPVERKKLLDAFALPEDSSLLENLAKQGILTRWDDVHQKIGDASIRMVRLADREENAEDWLASLTKKQKAVAELLMETGTASVKELCYLCGVTQAVVSALVKKGVAEYYDREIYRNPYRGYRQNGAAEKIILTPEQQKVFENLALQSETGRASLLFGVTGSGKTQVFLKLIDHVLPTGKGIIVMVPEISLTAQTLAIFHKRYGDKVAVLHSGLSVGERMDEWKRIRNGDAQIAVGTRSAVFAPFDNLGLVIMDEEQESTYKSEAAPRYHARDAARFRCAQHQALLLLASATPSIETYTAAANGRFTLNRLSVRYGDAQLPQVIPVDMRKELAAGNRSVLSERLLEELRLNLKEGRQSILLMNRRGYHTFISCRSCGHVMVCPHCSISLTYHRVNNRLMCHYCGYSQEADSICPACGEETVRFSGFGTQKLEDELTQLLPSARILRMDADTTMVRYAHEKGLNAFAEGKYDILLGTQMVAKGLDFENVTLVGVVNADQSLYNDDYRSLEKTFALLTQVVGRSGRGKYPGRAVIQTTAPEHPVLRLAAAQDYEAFYETEILTRRLMVYPPYCDICAAGFTGREENAVKEGAYRFLEMLKKENAGQFNDQKLIVLGPMPARVPRVSGKYRYRLLIKCRNTKRFREMMSGLLCVFGKSDVAKQVTVYLDMDPDGGL